MTTNLLTVAHAARVLCLSVILNSNAIAYASEAAGKKIVLIAGPITGHPKNTHEYEKSVILLKHLLDTSPNVRGARVEPHFRGWPAEPKTLDDADTIVLITDGGDRNAVDHPLYVGDRLAQLEKQMRRGCGLVMLHWTTFNPAKHHDQITEWVGGYFDYETGSTPNKWFSRIKTWDGPTMLGVADHPISRGVKPFRVKEEFYYNVRFRDGDTRVKPILRTRPPGETEDFTVGWAVERADGGRGFGCTGGHFFENWWLADYRRLILNAIVWSAKIDVPTGGVESKMNEPIRLLIVTGHNHPAHDWRRVTKALIEVLEQDPRVVVHVTEQPEDLATARIVDYDAIVMNYCNWDRPGLSQAARDNFANYVRRGGGLAVIHFANGAFTDTLPNKESDWPEYRTQLVRRIWVHGDGKSGHDAFGPFPVAITDAGKQHPITAGLADFDTSDELYFRQMGDLPITPLATAKSKVTKADEPMAWAYEFGTGQVFQTVLGHGDVSVRQAGALIRRGSVWSTKREPLSFDPPLELTENVLHRDGTLWRMEESLQRGGVTTNKPAESATAPLAAGKFGQALEGSRAQAFVTGTRGLRDPPLTVECWAKIRKKDDFQILVANETKASATHWELFTMAGSGAFTVYMPGMQPDHARSDFVLADDQWHYVAMTFEPRRVRLFVDGKQVADQPIESRGGQPGDGGLAIGSLVERGLGCDGLIDEVRISRGARDVSRIPGAPLAKDDQTLGLWRFDEISDKQQVDDESRFNSPATIEAVKKKSVADAAPPGAAQANRVSGHWGEDAVGFRWTEQDSVDNRFQQMDTGYFFAGTVFVPEALGRSRTHVAKGICIKLHLPLGEGRGEGTHAAACYDTELMRFSAAWTGPFLRHDPARYGLIVPPMIAGEVQFTSPAFPGIAKDGSFADTRLDKPFGSLPRDHARYLGMYTHGERVVLAFKCSHHAPRDEPTTRDRNAQGEPDRKSKPAAVLAHHAERDGFLESPALEIVDGVPIITRTIELAPNEQRMRLLACGADGVTVIAAQSIPDAAKLALVDGNSIVEIAAHDRPRLLKLAIVAKSKADAARLAELAKQLVPPTSLKPLTVPGPIVWKQKLTTRVISGKPTNGFAVDTIELPFENPYKALFFVSGHDFFANGDAAVCTAHGDVWRVTGLERADGVVTWQRFATGLFQPLGLKIVKDQVFIVGRDQITRLHDRDGNGEADFYECFNNDGHVTTNGHEYVACLETDHAGNFYFAKGDSGGKTKHDGCVLRVSPDGERLDVFSTGWRNANGMGIGPNDEITVAPQEGEWTPASGVFPITMGSFGTAVHVSHRNPPPTDFTRPIVWLSRRVDNSSGGQVWIPRDRWGPLGGQMLHLSYGQCTAMAVLQETVAGTKQGAAVVLPLMFESGVMRGRFHPRDGHLYLSGLHGWVSNSAQDGCFQRVRYTGEPLAMPVAFKSYANGLAITFSEPLDRDVAENADHYQAQQWNYRWSAQYGSPELRPSQPTVEGRDPVIIESASLLADGRTVFLEIADLQPVSQMQLSFPRGTGFQSAGHGMIHFTLHNIPRDSLDVSNLSRKRGQGYLAAEVRAKLRPGLIARFEQGSGDSLVRDMRVQRTAVLHVPAGEAVTPLLKPGPFRAVLEGYLLVKEPGNYTFNPSGTGQIKVLVNDKFEFEHVTLDVGRFFTTLDEPGPELSGFAKLRIEYEQREENSNAELRLDWGLVNAQSELISPTALRYLPDDELEKFDRRRLANELVERHRCAACHQLSSPHKVADGPILADAGLRLNEAWLARWLLDPTAMRNDTTMPRLLGAAEKQKAADLAAYVMTLRRPRMDALVRPKVTTDEGVHPTTARDGYMELGCVGCHRLTPPDQADEFNRVSLHQVTAKFQPQALVEYLRQPQINFPTTRMPDFQLADEEANALAKYLSEKTLIGIQEDRSFPKGNAERGERLVRELRCQHCHDIGNEAARRATDMAWVQPWSRSRPERGCLADSPPANAPRFAWTATERATLREFVRDESKPLQPSPTESADHLFASLRCGVCHARDEQPALLPGIVVEESDDGRLPDPLPNLTWAGEKLQAEWMEKFIAGQVPYRPRPHLKTRMPAFATEYAKALARGFAAQHGVTEKEPTFVLRKNASFAERTEMIIGYRLTLKNGGLDCRQCHGVGNQQPEGDDRTKIAPGINFVHVRDRMRYDFYRRFVLDPPRYDVSTKMPKLSADGKTTSAKHILDGDATHQFDAIWSYLQTVHGDEP